MSGKKGKKKGKKGRAVLEWIITHDGTGEKPIGFECERCGTYKRLHLPISVEKFLARGKGFKDQHAGCEEVTA